MAITWRAPLRKWCSMVPHAHIRCSTVMWLAPVRKWCSMVPRAPTWCSTVYVACSRTQMVQHGPTCTHPVQESLTAETEEGFASYRRPQAQRLGSWCTVAFLKLAHVSSCRQRKGSPRIDAHKPSAWDPGVQSHPCSWHMSYHSDRGRVRLVSTPTSPTFWILVCSSIHQVGTRLTTQTEEGFRVVTMPIIRVFGSRQFP